jgi:glutathione synthase/RimK-type ligase-like ATP-grasp enzyme
MSIDLNLRCKKIIAEDEVSGIISALGFRKMNGGYFWFETFQSFRGCWLTWTQATENPKTEFTASTNSARSYWDMKMQNDVIRKLRDSFGGYIFDPQSGGKRFLELPEELLTPA